jgi:single-strand DNA-binding protein
MALPVIVASGNMVLDANFQLTKSGVSRCQIRIACNDRKQVDGQWVDGDATFLDVILWRGLAEAASDLKKGQAVVVSGKLQVRNYEGKDGSTKTAVEIVATDIALSIKGKQVVHADADAWASEAPF